MFFNQTKAEITLNIDGEAAAEELSESLEGSGEYEDLESIEA